MDNPLFNYFLVQQSISERRVRNFKPDGQSVYEHS